MDAGTVFLIAHVTLHLEAIAGDVVQIADRFQKGRVGKVSPRDPLGAGSMDPALALARLSLEDAEGGGGGLG